MEAGGGTWATNMDYQVLFTLADNMMILFLDEQILEGVAYKTKIKQPVIKINVVLMEEKIFLSSLQLIFSTATKLKNLAIPSMQNGKSLDLKI